MYNDYSHTSKVLNRGDTITIKSHDIKKYINTLKWVTGCIAENVEIKKEVYKPTLKES